VLCAKVLHLHFSIMDVEVEVDGCQLESLSLILLDRIISVFLQTDINWINSFPVTLIPGSSFSNPIYSYKRKNLRRINRMKEWLEILFGESINFHFSWWDRVNGVTHLIFIWINYNGFMIYIFIPTHCMAAFNFNQYSNEKVQIQTGVQTCK